VKVIVGLGNPGIEYQFTFHNLGFLAADRIAAAYGVSLANRRCRALTGKAVVGGIEVLIAKPETYMNLSGLAVRELLREAGAEPAGSLILIYDDLDLPFGLLRVRKRGGAGGHHGVESVIGALGTPEFARIRLGISPGHKVADGAEYVLSSIKKSQYEPIDRMLDTAVQAVLTVLTEGADAAMNRFNRKAESDEPE
jgi:PTH1 family peptidyl-tRNA hydrolase